jgi:ACS family pantothenate transporter-like MFS transporter
VLTIHCNGRYVSNAWVPLLIYPASQAPYYTVGYKVNAALWGSYLLGIPVILWFSKKYPAPEPEEIVEREEVHLSEKDVERVSQ